MDRHHADGLEESDCRRLSGTRVFALASSWLACTVLLLGCSWNDSTSPAASAPPLEVELERLEDAGHPVSRGVSDFAQRCLNATRHEVFIGDLLTRWYEYTDEAAADEVQTYMNSEGYVVAVPSQSSGCVIDWVDVPHWYRSGRFLILYLGTDPGALELLESLFGPQFAGG